MEIINRLGFAAAAIAAAMLIGACSSTPITTKPNDPPPPPPQGDPVCCAPPLGKGVSTPTAVPAYLDPRSPLFQKRSVYFDFDQYALKPEYVPVLEMHGKYLAAHADVMVKVQGNTDEQGGAEYNLALGQKRADAVVNALKIYGAKDAQLEAVSFGKEKPKATGHDEAAHAQNRRADLAYPEK